MSTFQSHYEGFNVMKQKEHWDPHTLEIVEKRLLLKKCQRLTYFKQQEAQTLIELCCVILDDRRDPILSYVIHHFESKLKANIGEAQRKKGLPKESQLIHQGLQALSDFCVVKYDSPYNELKESVRKDLADKMIQGNIQFQVEGSHFPVKDFMKKIMTEAISAYYSHPLVWSEIGYAGPAYPRGYVRSEWGLTDPWEARRNE
jgi:hypothetical protein